ncbi:A-kinase anchor protein 9-like isoform X2 [Scylla paramamosain]|uniref:A-kinase anchor protein 9-like isoform X2 n=1 Tax=Scylla paramamosain TaxID=85552 RepID=UPI0030826DC6
MQVVRMHLEQFMAQWKQCAETHPSLLAFAEALAACVEDLSGHLLGLSNGDDVSAEVVVRCLQQAMIKGVSKEYQEAISATLETLKQDLNHTLHHITVPASLLDTPKSSSSLDRTSQQDTTQRATLLQEDDTQQDSLSSSLYKDNFTHDSHSPQDLTAKVEHLINVRTALVDAANEFNEELEEVLGQHLAPLKEQLQDVVKDREASVREEVSSLPGLPEHQAFIQEFTGFTSRVSQEAHTEKLQVLRNQQEMVHKILEDNQAKLSAVCNAFLESLHGLTSVEEMEGKGKALVDNLERTLAEEATWVEKQYRDLLEHYTQEQDSNNQAHALTCSHLVHTLTLLLQSNKNVSEPKELRQEHTRQVEQLREEHEEEIQRLEAQLAAKDQEALEIIDEEIAQLESDSHHSLSLRDELSSTLNTHLSSIRIQVTKQHLQGLYNDRDWYKKTVGLLSHVTLQLLHYYSVAQSLTHQPQEGTASPLPHPPESPTPGRILDLSFLSDCVGEEEEEMLAFSEDRALATGLMGRTTIGMGGEVEDAESALDGTAVSDGMMDDLDKDEQVRALLERSYPQLMAILKGRWDRVLVARLEKEVQELTISLQASAGMLRIFIHSVSGNGDDLMPHGLRDEVQEEGVKSSVLKVGHSESIQEGNEQKKESEGILGFSVGVQQTTATKDTTVPPSASILQQDLSCISEGLIQLLSQEESLPSFITLAPHDLQDKEQLKAVLRQLCEAAQATASLKLELHHTQGLQQGLEEERQNLQEEVNRLTHYSKNLAGELQVLKDQLEETDQENQRPVSHYAAKMEATKDVRERVRAALSAKNVAELERGQLEARVRELEGLLEAVVRESEVALEALRSRETDLSQQLEVADRQLKSARQFLEEHASERDQEVEELVAVRDKLTLQLRERDAQLVHHASQEKEVENLERQLWKKSEELQEALSKKEELQVENKASKDKICDLREIIQSLESQVDGHCMKEAELHEQVQELSDALTLAKQQAHHLSSQVEELRPGEGMQVDGQSADETTQSVSEDKAEGNICQHSASLLSELQEDALSTSVMFRQIEKRLRDTTRGLEAMQLSGSLEDISAQDVEVTVDGGEGRLSPSTVDRRLEDQLVALECTTEAAIKRNKDLQITIQNLQAECEEVTAERDTLQERSREQLVKISSLEARLDEVRRADHPAAADMRQRLALLQEDLEEKREELTKRSIEVEELKHSLSSLREQLTNREGELLQLQSASLAQPHSLPQTAQDHLAASYAQLEKDLTHKTHLLESLQKELSEIKQPSSLSPSLAEDLILEKNAEISELSSKVKALMCAIQKVYILIRGEGNLYEARQVLSSVLGREFVDALNESEEQEVLRRGEPEQMPSLVHNASVKEAAVIQVSPAPLQMSNEPEEDSVHTQPSAAEISLMSALTVPPPELSQVSQVTEDEHPRSQPTPASEAASSHPHSQRGASPRSHSSSAVRITLSQEEYDAMCSTSMEITVHKAHIELLTQEIRSLNDYQARLEEDFKAAQELLEAREAEILQLTEEVEDAPPMPLSTPLPHHPATQEMTTRLKAYEEQVDHLSAAVQRKSEEVEQLSTQLEHVHTEMKERLFEASREAARIEQQFQQQILDLKEQHMAREKKLCRDYEERVAKQVEEVAQRINKNKEAAMARQQEVFEATLRQAALERDQAQKELEQWHAASASPSPAAQMAPPLRPPEQQTATQLCASVDALVAGLKQELEKAGQLDLSMASLMRAGEGEASTRASSVLSDASDGEEPASINGRIQQLMNKIHKDGIEVLSLIDIMFLCKHCTQLDTSQRSFIASSGLMASSLVERGSAGEQTQLMRNLAAVEEELAKMEQEMKRKIGVLEFQLEQERMSGSEWKLSFESEKQHSRDMMEQLRKERLAGAEQVSELTLLRSQLLTIRLQLQKLQEENCSLSECQEKKDKQIENLQAALQVERSNFSRVSKVLSEERKVSGLTQAEQEAIIKDLRNSLEKERGRIVALCSHLERMTSQHSTQPPATTTPTPARHLKKSDPSRPAIEELQVQLAVERERCGELERACERERLQAVSQKEQATAERVQSKIEVRKVEGRLAELTRTIRSLETEKQRLVRQMSHEKERLQHQDSRIKELEGEVRKLEADSRAQSEAHQVMAERMREESTQLHVAYTRTLTKLGEAEAEGCELRHKLRTTVKELQMAREHEEQLKQDLHSARTAVDRMGLPALFRRMNQDGCSDLQIKANLELCRSMLQLTDDQRALRARIAELEDTVTSLNQQLLQAQESNLKNSTIEEKLKTERQVWETERASLQHTNQLHEAEVRRLRAEKNTQHSIPGTAEMQQLYGRYLQSEHWRKALVWQKQYLMLVIKGYSDTEQHTLARLTAMATPRVFPSSTSHSRAMHSRERFRVAVLVVVATCRMKNLVLRFHRKKRLCVGVQAAACSTISSPDNSRPQSSSSVVRGREAWPSTPQVANEAALSTSFTGLTPPTREPGITITYRPPSATHRSLFQEDSDELNQYVERLDNIHSVLGLTHKRQ